MIDEPYQDPEHAVPYLKLIRLGVPTWNKWIKGELTEEEAAEVVAKLAPTPVPDPPHRPTNSLWTLIPVNFSGVRFGDLDDFSGAVFGDRVNFSGAVFSVFAIFQNAQFGAYANFSGAVFGDRVNFSDAVFDDCANFSGAVFSVFAFFPNAQFGAGANFSGAQFGGWANFSGADLGHLANFSGAVFGGRVDFLSGTKEQRRKQLNRLAEREEIEEAKREDWVNAQLEENKKDMLAEISFSDTHFKDEVIFEDREFKGYVNFSHTKFDQPPTFENCDSMERIDVTGATFGFAGTKLKYLWWCKVVDQLGWTTDSNIPTRLRILRKQMEDIKAHDAERDLFIAERMAERGVLWDATFKKLFPLKSFMTMQWPVPLLKAIGATGLLFFFWLLSDCARSALRPFLWFIGNIALFYAGYAETIQPGSLGAGLSMLNEQTAWDDVLWRYLCDIGSFTTGHALPFIGSIGPAKQGAIERLFPHGEFEPLAMLPGVEAASILQSLIGALLLFLFLQAVRNHFRLR